MKYLFIVFILSIAPLFSESFGDVNYNFFLVNNTWMLVSTLLVFIMHLGFACLETGLTQSKNTVNILFKNVAVLSISILSFSIVGFGLMYPGDFNGYLGFANLGLNKPINDTGGIFYANGNYTYYTDFIFQAMFAATAATIVSGAVAERIKLSSFLLFSFIYVAFVYPVVGSWKWGGGWLQNLGFYDFAGSTLVHGVGGWAALVGAKLLKPRIGRFGKNATIKPIPGHNMPLASIGVFLLWFGWYGFNGGSVLSANPEAVSLVFVTTTLAACSGVIGAMMASWYFFNKPDLSMTLNGSLAGLVGITAGADIMSPFYSVIIGFAAGLLVVFSVSSIDRMKIDDPVGAISVHLVCGIWGTLAVGLFSSSHSLLTQLIGVVCYGATCLITSFLIFYLIKKVIGLRVSYNEELKGLDLSEHDSESYSGFQIFTVE